MDYSLPRSSPEMQPLGTPPAPAAPAVTDLEAGANQTNLRIAWQAVLPEGPGPTAYTVTYSNGATTGACRAARSSSSLTCTHSGVPYDGLTYTYRVVAANQPVGEPGNRSLPSEGTAIEAVGRPAAWGAFQACATGNSQEAELQYTVPDSRGTTSRVEILVGGLVAKSFTQQTGTNTTRVPVPSNEQPYPVQLRVCNENAPAGCTLSGQQNVQSYGRLDGMLNDIGCAGGQRQGRHLDRHRHRATATPPSSRYRIDGGAEQVINLTGVGAFSQPITARRPRTSRRASGSRCGCATRRRRPRQAYSDDGRRAACPRRRLTVEPGWLVQRRRQRARQQLLDQGTSRRPSATWRPAASSASPCRGFYETSPARSPALEPRHGGSASELSIPRRDAVGRPSRHDWYYPSGATVTVHGHGYRHCRRPRRPVTRAVTPRPDHPHSTPRDRSSA